MRSFSLAVASLLLVIGLVIPTTAQAQADFKLGPRLGIPFGDLGDRSSLYLGADARASLDAIPVVPHAAFNFYLTDSDNASVFKIDLNALYEFGIGGSPVVPYAGGGLGIVRTSVDTGGPLGTITDTDVGLNLVGGARFPVGIVVEPFAQFDVTVGDNAAIGLTGGVLYTF